MQGNYGEKQYDVLELLNDSPLCRNLPEIEKLYVAKQVIYVNNMLSKFIDQL